MSLRTLMYVVSISMLAGGCAHFPLPQHGEASSLGAEASASVPNGESRSNWTTVALRPPQDHGAIVRTEVYEGPAPASPTILGGPKAVADSDGPYLLDTGDELRLFVYGHPNLSRLYKVDHAGKISIPLIGNVPARGLTTYSLEGRVKHLLAARYIRDPHVTIDVFRNRPFFILGEVRNPGAFAYVNGMTIESAVAVAGGYSERASLRRMRLSRRINGLVESMEVPPDYVVLPGDTIYVFERFF